MKKYAEIQSEDCDLSIYLYVTSENEIEFWARGGISLVCLRSIEEIDSFIELLQAAKEEAVSFRINGEESNVS